MTITVEEPEMIGIGRKGKIEIEEAPVTFIASEPRLFLACSGKHANPVWIRIQENLESNTLKCWQNRIAFKAR